MRIFLRKLLTRLVDDGTRRSLKRVEFAARKRLARVGRPMDARDFRALFGDVLGLAPGDLVMVHASASMLNTRLSAGEILEELRAVVGPTGTIVVPTFPAMTSIRFMTGAEVFDARTTCSGMGALSEAVRRMPGAFRSTHPVKSVAAIGPAAAEVCAGHEACLYPFGAGSPYEKMLRGGVKIIGIGAPMSYLSFVHVAEDLSPERVSRPVWDAATYEKRCIALDGGAHAVRTKVHNIALMARADPEKFCRRALDPTDYVITRRWLADFFVVDGAALARAVSDGLARGTSIYD